MNTGHFRGMGMRRRSLRFRHADFEVTAQNLSTSEAQELGRLLSVFATSLERGKHTLAQPDHPPQGHNCDALRHKCQEGLRALVDVNLSRTDVIPGSRCDTTNHDTMLLCEGCSVFSDNASSRTDAARSKEQDTESLNTWSGIEAIAESKDTDTNSTRAMSDNVIASSIQSNCATKYESDSGSSIDFLFLARQQDPKAVLALERGHDDMMNKLR